MNKEYESNLSDVISHYQMGMVSLGLLIPKIFTIFSAIDIDEQWDDVPEKIQKELLETLKRDANDLTWSGFDKDKAIAGLEVFRDFIKEREGS